MTLEFVMNWKAEKLLPALAGNWRIVSNER